jgi:predicted RecB family nuclease
MINECIIYDYYICKYKAYLKYHQTPGVGHNYEMFEQRKIEEKESFIFSKIKNVNNILNLKDTNTEQFYFEKFYELIQNVTFSNNTFSIRVHLQSVKKPGEIGYLYYSIFFIPTYNIRHEHKLFVASCISIINNYSQHISQDCLVYNLSSNSPVNLKTNSYKKEAGSGLIELSTIIEKPPILYLNSHCQLCEYRFYCKKLAKEQDNLSLLKGLSVKEIKKLNEKGIFTVHQYSFTFRPRKKRKKNTVFLKKHHHALQALAIRTNKTYVYSNTSIPSSRNMIFIDIEYLPEEKNPYLIGLVIINGERQVQYSLWLNEINEYKDMIEQFLKIVCKYKVFQIYHFGQSELNFFKTILELDIKYKNSVEIILEKSVNILSVIYGNIYFPTFSNSLKDIANYLGFNWSTQNSTGLDAMYWRKHWLENNCEKVKSELIQYNIDDCLALKEVTNFIISAFQNNNIKYPDLTIATSVSEDLPSRYGEYEFGSQKFIIKDFEYINKCAYFDYQQTKVFIRTNKALKVQKKNRKTILIPLNKSIKIHKALVCPKCKSRNLRTAIRKEPEKRIVLDLLFFKGGIKRWNIEYTAHYQNCQNCRKAFLPQKYLDTKGKYGHNLISWIIYQSIVNYVSYGKIAAMLEDIFQCKYKYNFCDISEISARFYSTTYAFLKRQILNGSILHVDETKVNLNNGKGYVWIFSNMNTVYFLFRRDRTTDFMKDLLKGYKGVLISDFYKGYDGLDCKHQKCLIHLMRDVNKLLFKNQQDDEIKQIANDFGKLLRAIVDTIDKFGLKTWHLTKHLKEVNIFYKNLGNVTTNNAEIQTLINRFFKYRDTLFTFLNLDGIPWNNNNAEHGFTHFALYRKQANGLFTEESIERYLSLLSIYQTCAYRKLSFLHFLRSKEKDIDNYQRKYNKNGDKKQPTSTIYKGSGINVQSAKPAGEFCNG